MSWQPRKQTVSQKHMHQFGILQLWVHIIPCHASVQPLLPLPIIIQYISLLSCLFNGSLFSFCNALSQWNPHQVALLALHFQTGWSYTIQHFWSHIYIYIHTLLLDDICIPKIMNLSLFQTIMIRWFSSFCLYFNNNKNKTHYDLFGFQPFYLFVTFSFCKIKKKKKL